MLWSIGVPPRPNSNLFIHRYKCVFLALRHFFLNVPAAGLALGSVARGEPARTPHASLGPGRGPWQMRGGSKSQVRSGSNSENVKPSRPPQTHVQVKTKSDGSYVQVRRSPTAHVISEILNVVNVGRHYLVMERLKKCPTAHVRYF